MSTGSSDNTGGAGQIHFLISPGSSSDFQVRLKRYLPSHTPVCSGPESPRRLLAMAQVLDGSGPCGAALGSPPHARRRSTRRHQRARHPHLCRTGAPPSECCGQFPAAGESVRASIGVVVQNHRGMLDAIYGTAKAGGRALFLNSDFSGPQAVEVCAREGVEALFYDEEFAEVVSKVDAPKGRFVAWTDDLHGATTGTSVEALISTGNSTPPPAPDKHGKFVVLTSGSRHAQGRRPRHCLVLSCPRRLALEDSSSPRRSHVHRTAHISCLGIGKRAFSDRHGFDNGCAEVLRPQTSSSSQPLERAPSLVLVPTILNRLLSLGVETIKRLDLSSSLASFCAATSSSRDHWC